MQIGVLALQGAFAEHRRILSQCGVEAVLIRKPGEMKKIDGLIIPGGESTTIGKLMRDYHLDTAILEKTREGMPVFGTCAGLIMLAKDISGRDQFSLGLMDIKVKRNGFGRQVDSFEADLHIDALGKAPFHGVFIRAPYVESVKPNVGILAHHEGKIVMVRQGNFLGAAFHPELTDDLRVHLYFKQMIEDAKNAIA
ncbi:pyridoxal 5'-phosphate synthase glutaminase subunit PdxT [Candidatus Formimonas warabiya]|uniref:Pyridoxal 5'-phosphate synthase subunit PdxT n=1 Tax=Formimonas warabiya TaxID=1761012 RepID=A0A3G1KV68_FORW1|nr:pyridoxal 5'-phosphate synthase glutaminase subunit PdxT [Candidatus Formimonas warabiya]ATW26413.1 glutamine amidotransferase subunit PdxT [Candidatus Formimonas warabiya]